MVLRVVAPPTLLVARLTLRVACSGARIRIALRMGWGRLMQAMRRVRLVGLRLRRVCRKGGIDEIESERRLGDYQVNEHVLCTLPVCEGQ